jgi:Flp pilus assembly pilin Flp
MMERRTMHAARSLKRDARGATLVEYLVITGAVGLVLVAAAALLRDGYAEALIQRANSAMGVE